MWVKICANTSLDDTLLAAELGADAVGFVFAESKRKVSPQQVAAITSHLPSTLEKVGVFSHHTASEIAEIVHASGLDSAQLHNGYDPALVSELRHLLGHSFGQIQTVHWKIEDPSDTAASANSNRMDVDLDAIANSGDGSRVLVDSSVGKQYGGTGVSFDWKAAARIFAAHNGDLRMIAAGGLRPENLASAISIMRPWGVDVASGVESTPGCKDPEKVVAFLRIAKSSF